MTQRWSGTNGFRMTPDDLLASAPSTASVASAAGGHATIVRYTWEHPTDGPQDGVLLVGSAAEGSDDVTAAWGDSWHQQPGLMTLAGHGDGDRIELAAEYAGGWGWTIALSLDDPLTITMCNLIPAEHAGTEASAGYEVMVAGLHPVAG